jgi:citrate/tricarballylate utilization protein
MPGLELFQEANRQLTICNACRYCEGYCAVFQAIELRKDFAKGDVLYLAHLCHDCRACYYACMYAPPHEFAINIPSVMAEVRIASYPRFSWPTLLAGSFSNSWIGGGLVAFIAALVVILSVLLVDPGQMFTRHLGPGAFYVVISYLAMVIPGMAMFFYAMAVWIVGGARFWSEVHSEVPANGGLRAFAGAIREALTLRNLTGGGPGCYYPEAQPSSVRRIYHGFVAWGFLSAVTSTVLAAIYQGLFGWLPPYSLTSAPVIFGSAGGVAMIIGTTGLVWFKSKSDLAPAGVGAASLDFIFLATLGLVSLTGMLTLAFRSTRAMGSMLTIHLGFVAATFVTAPYGKFVHLVYRCLALIRHHAEQGHLSRTHEP